MKAPTQDHKGIIAVNTSTGGNRTLFLIRTAGMGLYDGGVWHIGSQNVGNDE